MSVTLNGLALILNTSLEGWLPVADAVLKATILLAAAGVASAALYRSSAALRHFIWTLALFGALALPALSTALPRWELGFVTLSSPAASALAEPSTATAPPLHGSKAIAPAASGSPAAPDPVSAKAPIEPLAARRALSWTDLIVGLWAFGAIAILGRLLIGVVAVQWMSRRTERVTTAPWLPLAQELANELGVSPRLTFLRSARATMPMAWGVLRPAVLMPIDADDWPIERLRIVLLHELAHVKRRDCLTHMISQLACALYWFNPLAWIAARRARTERERACDDLVLAAGTRGADYAQELLEIARIMRAGRFPAVLAGATLAMAHRSQLEGRVIAILDPKIPRASMTRRRTTAATLALAGTLVPLASLQPWAYAEPTPATLMDDAGQARLNVPPLPPSAPTVATAPKRQPADPGAATAASTASQGGQDPKVSTWIEPRQLAHEVEHQVDAAIPHVSANVSISGAREGALAGVRAVPDPLPNPAPQERRSTADPKAVAALTEALKDSDKDVRETALHALVQMRDPATFEPLVQALRDSSADVREQAAHGLGQLRDRRAVGPLTAALKDQNPNVREQVVFALGQLKDPKSVDALVLALKDENANVREQTAFALGQIRDPRTVDALAAVLKDANGNVRQQAAFALGQIRDRRAATALGGALNDPNENVREQAVFALGQLRDPAAIDGLTAALHDAKPDVREQAAFALGQIRDRRSVEPLISALKDSNADVREQAAFALGQIRDRAAVEALVIALKDADADVRQQAAFALGQLRDPRAIEGLTAALKDTSASVRQQAAFALGQIAR